MITQWDIQESIIYSLNYLEAVGLQQELIICRCLSPFTKSTGDFIASFFTSLLVIFYSTTFIILNTMIIYIEKTL